MLDGQENCLCVTVGPTLPASLELLNPHSTTFYRYYFGRGLSELTELATLSFAHGSST